LHRVPGAGKNEWTREGNSGDAQPVHGARAFDFTGCSAVIGAEQSITPLYIEDKPNLHFWLKLIGATARYMVHFCICATFKKKDMPSRVVCAMDSKNNCISSK